MKMDEALQLLKDNGYKITDKRKNMIEIFATEKKYLTAKDVLEKLKSNFPNISFDTIYRNLTLFAELNILELTEWAGEKKFCIRSNAKAHHHHLICMGCGKTKEIYSCPMENLSIDHDFEIYDHKFEIYGICHLCKEGTTTSVNLLHQ